MGGKYVSGLPYGTPMCRALTRWAAAAVASLVAVLALAVAGYASDLKLTTTVGGAQAGPGAQTVPFFNDSFSLNGTTYPYTMVGTNPRTSKATTTVPTVVVPLRFVFADGQVAEPGVAVNDVVASPLFQSARFKSGTTQYGDAIRRAMFWSYDANAEYHVLLGQPSVLATQTIDVPESQGAYVPTGTVLGTLGGTTIHAAVPLGAVNEKWLVTALDHLLNTLNVSPTTLPILLSRNVVTNAGTVGFHGARELTSSLNAAGPPNGNQAVRTEIWASFGDPYFFAEAPNIAQNTDILSHEISEWLHDPFISNTVPSWQSPLPISSALYGCTSLLETGDPLADATFTMNGYQLQDEAFLSWFAHQEPSIGIKGQYTYLGTFTQPSPLC
jgi:hypothetical protein